MTKIILTFKGTLIKEYPLDKHTMSIGRESENDIKIDEIVVSRHHAKVLKLSGSCVIVDLESTNGTFVNRKRVTQATLYHEDEITIGKYTLIFMDKTQIKRREKMPDTDVKRQHPRSNSEEERAFDIRSKEGIGKTEEIENIASLSIISEQIGLPEIKLIKKITIIGAREDADIKLKGTFAPKVAALINKKPSGYSMIPSEEKSKVKINSRRITKQTTLADGDVIEIGSEKLLFSIP